MLTIFEYRYRDAGNFKAFGEVVLNGGLTFGEMEAVRCRLSGDGFFIAEQLGLPPLYEQLYRWSGGRTSNDHCWHEFVGISTVADEEKPAQALAWGDAKDFVARLLSTETWDESLSRHFGTWPSSVMSS